MQQKTSALYVTAKSTGLEINTNKTKSLRTNTHNTAAITINGKSIEDVNNFTYLGSIVSKHGGANEDISLQSETWQSQTCFYNSKTYLEVQKHQQKNQAQNIRNKRQISSTVRFRNLETD